MTWIFGYGSLMWNPGFSFAERKPALLRGYYRWFGSLSVNSRGTEESPGMMMNLIPGGSCVGAAYRLRADDRDEAMAYLDEREGEGKANRRALLPLKLLNEGGEAWISAWTYLPMASAKNYVGVLSVAEMLPLLDGAPGKIGTSHEYLRHTLEALAKFNAPEPRLEALLQALEDYRKTGAPRGAGLERGQWD